jgi:hypothetical protein
LRRLLKQPHAEAAPTFGHLHARLLWCQVDADDLAELRDRVLVPAVTQALAQPPKDDQKADLVMAEDLVGLLALVPVPTEAKAQAAWNALMTKIATTPAPAPAAPKSGAGQTQREADKYQRAFAARRASAARERANPPPMIKKVSFCNVGEASAAPTLDQ